MRLKVLVAAVVLVGCSYGDGGGLSMTKEQLEIEDIFEVGMIARTEMMADPEFPWRNDPIFLPLLKTTECWARAVVGAGMTVSELKQAVVEIESGRRTGDPFNLVFEVMDLDEDAELQIAVDLYTCLDEKLTTRQFAEIRSMGQ